jgi:hypothetical protein
MIMLHLKNVSSFVNVFGDGVVTLSLPSFWTSFNVSWKFLKILEVTPFGMADFSLFETL